MKKFLFTFILIFSFTFSFALKNLPWGDSTSKNYPVSIPSYDTVYAYEYSGKTGYFLQNVPVIFPATTDSMGKWRTYITGAWAVSPDREVSVYSQPNLAGTHYVVYPYLGLATTTTNTLLLDYAHGDIYFDKTNASNTVYFTFTGLGTVIRPETHNVLLRDVEAIATSLSGVTAGGGNDTTKFRIYSSDTGKTANGFFKSFSDNYIFESMASTAGWVGLRGTARLGGIASQFGVGVGSSTSLHVSNGSTFIDGRVYLNDVLFIDNLNADITDGNNIIYVNDTISFENHVIFQGTASAAGTLDLPVYHAITADIAVNSTDTTRIPRYSNDTPKGNYTWTGQQAWISPAMILYASGSSQEYATLASAFSALTDHQTMFINSGMFLSSHTISNRNNIRIIGQGKSSMLNKLTLSNVSACLLENIWFGDTAQVGNNLTYFNVYDIDMNNCRVGNSGGIGGSGDALSMLLVGSLQSSTSNRLRFNNSIFYGLDNPTFPQEASLDTAIFTNCSWIIDASDSVVLGANLYLFNTTNTYYSFEGCYFETDNSGNETAFIQVYNKIFTRFNNCMFQSFDSDCVSVITTVLATGTITTYWGNNVISGLSNATIGYNSSNAKFIIDNGFSYYASRGFHGSADTALQLINGTSHIDTFATDSGHNTIGDSTADNFIGRTSMTVPTLSGATNTFTLGNGTTLSAGTITRSGYQVVVATDSSGATNRQPMMLYGLSSTLGATGFATVTFIVPFTEIPIVTVSVATIISGQIYMANSEVIDTTKFRVKISGMLDDVGTSTGSALSGKYVGDDDAFTPPGSNAEHNHTEITTQVDILATLPIKFNWTAIGRKD